MFNKAWFLNRIVSKLKTKEKKPVIYNSNELISKEISEYYAKKKKDPNIMLEELLMIGIMESWDKSYKKVKQQVEETKRVNRIFDWIIILYFFASILIGLIVHSLIGFVMIVYLGVLLLLNH